MTSDVLELLWSDLLPVLKSKPLPDLVWFQGPSGGRVGAPAGKLRDLATALKRRDPRAILVTVTVPHAAIDGPTGLDGGLIEVRWAAPLQPARSDSRGGLVRLHTAGGVLRDGAETVNRRTVFVPHWLPAKNPVTFGSAAQDAWPRELIALIDLDHKSAATHAVQVSDGYALTTDGKRAHAYPCELPEGAYTVTGARIGPAKIPAANVLQLNTPRSGVTLDVTAIRKLKRGHYPRIDVTRADTPERLQDNMYTDLNEPEDWRTGNGSVYVPLAHVLDALDWVGEVLDVGIVDPLAPVLFRGESGRVAVVMPCSRPR